MVSRSLLLLIDVAGARQLPRAIGTLVCERGMTASFACLQRWVLFPPSLMMDSPCFAAFALLLFAEFRQREAAR